MPDRAAAQRDRDAALTRVSRVRRITIVGAGALTAALAAVVSAVAPGRSLGAKTPVHAPTVVVRQARARTIRMPPLASPNQLGLQAPGAAPQAAPQTQTQAQTQASAPPAQAQPQQQAAPQPAPVSGGS